MELFLRPLHSSRAMATTSTILEVKRRFVNEIDGGKIHTELSVGEAAKRSGVAVSTLHFYESKGLIRSSRSPGNQRRYARGVLRRIATIKVAQKAGVPLATIRQALASLPQDRAPTLEDWRQLSTAWRMELDSRIRKLTQLRDRLLVSLCLCCMSPNNCPFRKPFDEIT